MTEHPGHPLHPDDGAERLADLARMIARLGAPAACSGDGGRPLIASTGSALFDLVDEIDEVVLARRLVLRNAAGAVLELETRNRRLFHADFGAGARPDEAALLFDSAALDRDNPEGRARFAALLRGFCSSGAVSLRSAPPRRATELDDSGVSAATLRALVAPASAGDPRQPLAELAETLTPLCHAWVFACDPEPAQQHGDPESCDGLFLALEQVDKRLGRLADDRPIALMLSAAAPSRALIGLVTDGRSRLILMLSAQQEQAVHAAWSDWLQRQAG